jgi:hypothetical protein
VTHPAAGNADPKPPTLPPDPVAYDDPRAARARARGLSTPYIPGGRDPDPAAADAEERRLWRILVVFVVVIVLSGFIFGVINELVLALTA